MLEGVSADGRISQTV